MCACERASERALACACVCVCVRACVRDGVEREVAPTGGGEVGRVERGIQRHYTILVCEHAHLMQTIPACMHIICVCMTHAGIPTLLPLMRCRPQLPPPNAHSHAHRRAI